MFQVVYKTSDEQSWSYVLPEAMDPDGDLFSVDVVESPTVMEFVSFDSNSGTLEIEDLSS